jgi:hypothetical protein
MRGVVAPSPNFSVGVDDFKCVFGHGHFSPSSYNRPILLQIRRQCASFLAVFLRD